MRFPSFCRPIAAVIAAAALAGGSAHADSVGDFYKGKTLTIIVSTDAGNGYDFTARVIARHLSRYLPGNPTIIVQNMPGAGGIVGADYVYNVAPKDGLAVGEIQNTVPFEPFYGNKQAKFDATKMNWLGSPGQETGLLIVWHTVPVKTLAEAKSRGLVLAATGSASTPAFYARVITAVFGVPIKVIPGYKSQTEAFLAMERGENEGYSSTFLSSLKATHPDWLTDKSVSLLLQYGGVANSELPEIPFAADLLSGDDKILMQIAAAPLALGRPLFAPPGVPADRLAALRKGFDDTFADPNYRADCAKQGLTCDQPGTGADIAAIIAKSYGAPAEIHKRLLDIYTGAPSAP